MTFDGAPAVRTRGSGAIIGVASVDATQEMQVLTADYQAEYGSAAGGQMRHRDQERDQGISRFGIRVSAEFGDERQHLDAQS